MNYEDNMCKLKFENIIQIHGKSEMPPCLPTSKSFFHFSFLRPLDHIVHRASLLCFWLCFRREGSSLRG